MGPVIKYGVSAAFALLVITVGSVAGVVGAATSGTTATACDPRDDSGPESLTGEQACNAAVIVRTGHTARVPRRGVVVAVAVALQESSLRNLSGGDLDSVGLFQQRPSMGWGTPTQLMDPVYASRAFYQALLKVPGWEAMPLADAAQTVQRSADGSLYARHATRAAAIATACTQGRCGAPASAWVRPAPGPVVSGYRTAGRPGHDGIDIGARRGATVRAASAGVVKTVVCDSSSGTCDRDGSPQVQGCGWYVELQHAGNVVTRYCHMLARPTVRVGQPVTTGQPIGLVGSSGNSSGPHLHLEVHTGYPATESNATNPAPFLRGKGVRL